MEPDDQDIVEKFRIRVSAMFAANKILSSVARNGLGKIQNSALSFSKYLSAVYVGTFVFLLSGHEEISLITGGKGSVIWTTLIVLVCLVLESYAVFTLYVKVNFKNYIEEISKETKHELKDLDDQGQDDFSKYLDQLLERFVSSALDSKTKVKFNFVQDFYRNNSKMTNEVSGDYATAIKNVISSAEQAKESILNSTDKLGKIIGDESIKVFARMILSSLIFFLYLFGLSILLFLSIINNYKIMFSWLISLFKYF